MKLTLEKKDFQLKFGFKCFLNLGKALGLSTFNEVVERFQGFGQNNDFQLDQLELIEQLVIAASEAHPKYCDLPYSILDVAILDEIFAQPEILQQVLTEFAASFPKNEGKPQPRKTARATKKKS